MNPVMNQGKTSLFVAWVVGVFVCLLGCLLGCLVVVFFILFYIDFILIFIFVCVRVCGDGGCVCGGGGGACVCVGGVYCLFVCFYLHVSLSSIIGITYMAGKHDRYMTDCHLLILYLQYYVFQIRNKKEEEEKRKKKVSVIIILCTSRQQKTCVILSNIVKTHRPNILPLPIIGLYNTHDTWCLIKIIL